MGIVIPSSRESLGRMLVGLWLGLVRVGLGGVLIFLYINKYKYMFISLIYNINNIKNNLYIVFEPILRVHMMIYIMYII